MKEEVLAIIDRQIEFGNKEESERKLNDCINILSKAAKLVSQSKGSLERAKAKSISNYPDLNSRLLKLKIDSETILEQEELELAEKLWLSLNKTIDGLKSLLIIQETEVKW